MATIIPSSFNTPNQNGRQLFKNIKNLPTSAKKNSITTVKSTPGSPNTLTNVTTFNTPLKKSGVNSKRANDTLLFASSYGYSVSVPKQQVSAQEDNTYKELLTTDLLTPDTFDNITAGTDVDYTQGLTPLVKLPKPTIIHTAEFLLSLRYKPECQARPAEIDMIDNTIEEAKKYWTSSSLASSVAASPMTPHTGNVFGAYHLLSSQTSPYKSFGGFNSSQTSFTNSPISITLPSPQQFSASKTRPDPLPLPLDFKYYVVPPKSQKINKTASTSTAPVNTQDEHIAVVDSVPEEVLPAWRGKKATLQIVGSIYPTDPTDPTDPVEEDLIRVEPVSYEPVIYEPVSYEPVREIEVVDSYVIDTVDAIDVTPGIPNAHEPSKKPKETNERKLLSRQRQIDIGKETIGYKMYTESVKKSRRKKEDPRTPNKYQICSKRSWEGQVAKWRRQLHGYDPEPKKLTFADYTTELVKGMEAVELECVDMDNNINYVEQSVPEIQVESKQLTTNSQKMEIVYLSNCSSLYDNLSPEFLKQ